MVTNRPRLILLGGLSFALMMATGCAEQAPPPTPTKTPNGLVAAPTDPPAFQTPTSSITPTEEPTEGPEPTATFPPTETPQSAPTWTPPPTQEVLPPDRNHQWLQRPIAEGFTNFVDRNYPYGSTARGKYRVHHGYEFNNPRGTPVLAPAAGEVVFAGEDLNTQFGPRKNYYGRLVVIQMDAVDPAGGQPIYLLFAHLDSVEVEVGDQVEADDVLGAVGNTGVALGAHLHFEVRLGDMNDFNAVRNADLWLAPFNGFGTLAGQVVDGNGGFWYEVAVTAQDIEGEIGPYYTWTYADDTVQSDDVWEENFTLGDVPEGWYRVYINHPSTGKTLEDYVFVEAGKITWVEFVAD